MKKLSFLILLVILFASCKENTVTSESNNYVLNFRAAVKNDTIRVDFEASGRTTSQRYDYTALSFSTNNFGVIVKIDTVTAGSIKINLFKQDTTQIFTNTYSAKKDTLELGYSSPPLNKMSILPVNFMGKGYFLVNKR